MSRRITHDNDTKFAVWNKRTSWQVEQRKVLVAHADASIGESIVLMIGLRGYAALYAPDLDRVRLQLEFWQPHVVFLDTRLENKINFAFTRAISSEIRNTARLLIAMSDIVIEEPAEKLESVGFDGLCRRPCPIWRLLEILNDFFTPSKYR